MTNIKTPFTVFGWFVNLVSTFGAITWICILWTHMLVFLDSHQKPLR